MLSTQQTVEFEKEFSELFEPKGRRVARVDGTLHRIHTEKTRPFKAQAARYNPKGCHFAFSLKEH